MKIAAVDIYEYSLRLNRPLTVRGGPLPNREGLIVHLKSEQGTDGFGEAAPLPGFSPETLAEARDQIRAVTSGLCGRILPEGLERLDGQFERWLGPFALKPSVRFAMESAVLHLMANARNVPLYKLLSPTARHQVRVAGLLTGTKHHLTVQTRELIARGFTEIKLKIGGGVQEDIARVQMVNDAARGKALLHLDANQAWDFDRAVAFGRAVGCAAVSYIEEPFKEISKIPDFFNLTMIPVALDESLRALPFDDIKSISGVETLVLKPTVMGGIEKTWQMINKAKGFAINAVVSSSFESSLGIWTLASLAAGAFRHNSAAGLDTLKWFETDVFKQPVPVHNGAVRLGEQPIGAGDINFKLLSKI